MLYFLCMHITYYYSIESIYAIELYIIQVDNGGVYVVAYRGAHICNARVRRHVCLDLHIKYSNFLYSSHTQTQRRWNTTYIHTHTHAPYKQTHILVHTLDARTKGILTISVRYERTCGHTVSIIAYTRKSLQEPASFQCMLFKIFCIVYHTLYVPFRPLVRGQWQLLCWRDVGEPNNNMSTNF